MVERLSDFPWVIIRVDFPLCPHRKGRYRLTRLSGKYGADIQLCDLMDKIAFDCPWKTLPWDRPRTSMTRSARRGSQTWRLPVLLRLTSRR